MNGSQNMDRYSGKTKKQLIAELLSTVTILVVVTSVAALAIYSFAWFAESRETLASDIGATTESVPFRLGAQVTGGGIRLKPVDEKVLELFSSENYEGTAVSNGSGVGIVCALNIDHRDDLVRPGTEGTLTFRILPREADSFFVSDIKLCGLVKEYDANDEIFLTMADPETESDPEKVIALNYLRGHILLFLDSAHTKMLLPGDPFTISCPGSSGDYTVTLYWEWPRRYDELSAALSGSETTSGTVVSIDDTYHLYNGTGRKGYNNADQMIGDQLDYIAAIISVNMSGASNAPDVTASATAQH